MKHISFLTGILFCLSMHLFAQEDGIDIDSLREVHGLEQARAAKSSGIEFVREEERDSMRTDEKNRYLDYVDSAAITGKDSARKKEDDTLESGDTSSFYNELNEDREFYSDLAPKKDDSSRLKRYGIDFIRRRGEVDSYGPVNSEYRIGVGDEIVIIMWGNVEMTKTYTVNRLGTISPKGVGRVMVTGLSLEELKETLTKRFSRSYSGIRYGRSSATTHLDVALGRLRTRKVYIVGDVREPGVYNVPSMVGIFGALSYAGGPGEKGSLRNIVLKRGGSSADTLDCYRYIRDSGRAGNVGLADYDIIEVGPIQTRVALDGAVHRPAVYELKEGETFTDLIDYGGGFLPEAYRGSCNIERTIPGKERRIFTFSIDSSAQIDIHKNDSVYVQYLKRQNRTVEISGPVERSGTYAYEEGMHLSDLIETAGGVREEAFGHRVEILRTFENYEKKVLSAQLDKVLAGKSDADIALQKWDIVKVYSRWDVATRDYVVIEGEVKKPGRYFLRDNMTVQDILLLAGGFTKNAYRDTVEVSRYVENSRKEGMSTSPISIPVDSAFYRQNSVYLSNKDYVFVRRNSQSDDQAVITLSGEFLYPGKYAKLTDTDRLSALIRRSGGVKNSAYLAGAKLIRRKDSIGIVALDFEELIEKNDEEEDIILEDGDSIYVPTEPKTVKVEGAVYYPAAVKFSRGRSVGYYLDGAGGLTSKADKRSIVIVKANGEVQDISRYSRDVNPGSRIIVAQEPEKDNVNSMDIIRFTQALLGIMTSAVSLAILAEKVN
ncbi:MAG: SLBB domain-containing protein [Fibrobacterota bacterium]